MRTDDLIAALSRDPVPALPPVRALMARALAITVPVSALLMIAVIGVRPDAGLALLQGWFGLKLALVAIIAAAGWRIVAAEAQPDRALPAGVLALAVLALLFASAADLGLLGSEGWQMRLIGKNAVKCMALIPLLAAAPLAGLLHALRDAAPGDAGRAGAAAGFLAGALGALFYGLHCTDDSPLFVLLWYSAAIGLVGAVGAAIGRRMLRW